MVSECLLAYDDALAFDSSQYAVDGNPRVYYEN